ncbi:MAG TPA: hypothetical protein VFP83_07225, partial [Candidatus Limnocylindria bacterium]|nr:hypothetical protein [Candidatus Limnocylindria bacterium]
MHERALTNPWRLALVLGLAFALAVITVLSPSPVRGGAQGQKVVIIVGPVGGGSIQDNYLNRGEQIAQSVEARGGTAVRVFSPNATYEIARAAVYGANIIVFIGHGSGFPNPYTSTMIPAWTNGWGLNRVAGTAPDDPTGHGHSIGGSAPQMVYCGEAALEGKPKPSSIPAVQWCAGGAITPAPNFVMVFSNACYAPGAGETESTTPTGEALARTRVENFSRPYIGLGGTYFASDLGSRSVVEAILDNPDTTFGEIFTMGSGYSAAAVRQFPHSRSVGKEAWIQRTSGPGGLMSYWYAFGGDPGVTPSGIRPDMPVPADYDGNGTAEPAVWRPSNGTWYVHNGATTQWGQAGDKPVPADYDGNGTTDLAVWRPSNGTWYVLGGASTQWGQAGDVP